MMMKISVVTLTSALFFATPVFAESAEDAMNLCKQYAKDDDIPAEELRDYLADCVDGLTSTGSDEAQSMEPPESSSEQEATREEADQDETASQDRN